MENMIARLWTNSRVDVVLKTRCRQSFSEVSAQQPENGGEDPAQGWNKAAADEGWIWLAATGDGWQKNWHQTWRPEKIFRFLAANLLN